MALSYEPDFNVTFLTSSDFKQDFSPENDRLHFMRLDSVKEMDSEQLFYDCNDDVLAWSVAWFNFLKARIIDNEALMNELKAMKFTSFL